MENQRIGEELKAIISLTKNDQIYDSNTVDEQQQLNEVKNSIGQYSLAFIYKDGI